ncbi:MAG: EAL domain-containing response regulator [Gammaproteobacteria bacterium]|nr:EAL domain-containing response regulator [Gammaproteobacteria bacterium]
MTATATAADTRTRVLVVDDDAETAAVVAAALRRAGFAPTIADGSAAITPENLQHSNIIVLDLLMPGRDGLQVLRDLAEQGCDAGILLASSVDVRILAAAERLATGRGLRLMGSLRKPFEVSELLDVITSPIPDAPRKASTEAPRPKFSADEIRGGLERDEFIVHFQPKISVKTLEFVAVEALARWAHPEKGLQAPGAFIDTAEKSGLIGMLTEKVIHEAFHQCAEWLDSGLRLKVAVNVSTRSLGNYDLPEWFEEQTRSAGILPHQVVIEITESWLGNDPLAMLEILTRLRMKGFSLSIDDFGTGYSTMLKLKTIPFSELKLDQQFIRDAAGDAEARYIVESSIALGQKLGLHLVAEGIERQEDWDLITELGCDEGQGYFIARPMNGQDVPHWLRRWMAYLGQD